MEILPLELCIPVFGLNAPLLNKELNKFSKNIINIEKCNKVEVIYLDENLAINGIAKELVINMNCPRDLNIDKKINKLTLNYIGKDVYTNSTEIVIADAVKHLHLKRYLPKSIISSGLETLEITEINCDQAIVSNLIKNLKLNKLIVRDYRNIVTHCMFVNILYLKIRSYFSSHIPNIYVIFNDYTHKIINGQSLSNNVCDYRKENDILIFTTKCNHIKIDDSFITINNLINYKKYNIKYTPNLEYIRISITSKHTISLNIDDEIFSNLKGIYINGNISFEQDLSSCPNLIYWNILTTSQIKLSCYSENDDIFGDDIVSNNYYKYKNTVHPNTLVISENKLLFDNIVDTCGDSYDRNISKINIDDYNPLSLRIVNTKQEIITLLTSKPNITSIECKGLVNLKFDKHIIIDELHITSDDTNLSIIGTYEIKKLYAPIYLKNQISQLKYNCKIINYDTYPYFDTL